jgi:hypothetical protein
MKKILITILSIVSIFLNAQNVGIGVANPQNKLHVGGGFRLDTLTGVGGAGLVWHNPNGVVYGIKFSGNTNDVLRGDGSFGALNINGAVGWLLNGNSGTNPATNFLGTTDNQPLVFKINNIRHGYLSGGNISFGSNAGALNTGRGNISIGSGALGVNVIANGSVAIGDSALAKSTLHLNTAIGYRTLYSSTTGYDNVAVGSEALTRNTTGTANTAVGSEALTKNTTGIANIAVGRGSLISNTIGNFNTSVGGQSMFNNISGEYNCALGWDALLQNTTGSQNTALGTFASFANTTAHNNTAVGYSAMSANNANENSALGFRAMAANTAGVENSAFGSYALETNVFGSYNCAFGRAALRNNKSSANAAFGAGALASNQSGNANIAIGYSAMYLNQSGGQNTAIGSSALVNNLTGSFNTAVGNFAGFGLPNNVSNVTVIGNGTGWNTTSSNQVNIGNFSVSWIGGQTGWFHYSDKRIKNDIKDDVPGLSFITRLKPITYHVDIDKQEEIASPGKIETNSELIKPGQKNWEGKYDVEKIKMTGFFAQDVEEAAKSINYSFSGIHNPKNGGLYSLDYSAFVVPLVKAVQEQQSIIEKQQQLIDELLKRVTVLEKK